ncbi:hypothetical protein CV102_25500 [Natronococcus pandeyae]|uniref:Uncharacterized protein n=1 Tax=Natronococcus pandeyae TaxID=2055836 RepID=A0A8J8Q2E0_9EURY|nr:hypothetical protein [Natronococcus pandeyae]TYL35865.1 hypothetical protein CV102_25500 [Natronococcus pandeyae]
MSDEHPRDDPADRDRDGIADRDSSDDPRADAPSGDESTSTAPRASESTDRGPDERTPGSAAGSAEKSPDEPPDDGAHTDEDRRDSDDGFSDRAAFWISLAFGFALAIGSVALVSGRAPFFEDLLRVRPTVEGGGVGADWVVGNTEPLLEWMIVLVHFADVVMGIFILLIVFIHWAAFRRLAARMQPPGARARERETAAATDGGAPESRRVDDGDGGESP